VKKRPINLNFFTLYFPITAWVSIAHRLSGILVFLFIPVLLWMLQESLASKERYQALMHLFQVRLAMFFLWGLLAALIYHLVAGTRHLLTDLHIGESKQGGKRGACLVIGISALLIALIGCWLW
jgi:succinate dehydrogenase / fumarate reductase cytochrome b subunit